MALSKDDLKNQIEVIFCGQLFEMASGFEQHVVRLNHAWSGNDQKLPALAHFVRADLYSFHTDQIPHMPWGLPGGMGLALGPVWGIVAGCRVEQFGLVAKQGLILRVYVQPGAGRSQLAGLRLEEVGGKQIERLKIRLRARAQEGAANEALLAFLAEILDCPKSSISLTSGHTSRAKCLLIVGSAQEMIEKLRSALSALA